jgi:hypothetical protein
MQSGIYDVMLMGGTIWGPMGGRDSNPTLVSPFGEYFIDKLTARLADDSSTGGLLNLPTQVPMELSIQLSCSVQRLRPQPTSAHGGLGEDGRPSSGQAAVIAINGSARNRG